MISASTGRPFAPVTVHCTSSRLDNPGGLRALAERYRRLAESLFDPNIIAVVLDCARELEENARQIIERRSRPGELFD